MKLGDARRVRQLSIADLAKKAGVSFSTIREIELGQRPKPTMRACAAIARALGLAPQMIDEFRLVVGTPAMLWNALPQSERDAVMASIAEGDEIGLLHDKDVPAFEADIKALGHEPTEEEFKRIWVKHAQRATVAA